MFKTKTAKTKPLFSKTVIIETPLYVAIDVAKYYHKAMIFDFDRNVIEPPFTFDISREGFNQLMEKIEINSKRTGTNSIVVGMEATGHYNETLLEHLKARGLKVMLFNPYATFKTRALDIDYVKTDEIDLKAIGQAMLLGKGREARDEEAVYKDLRLLTRFRRAKNNARRMLKNQMLRDLDRLWPGLMKDAHNPKGLFTNLWHSKVARELLKLDVLPQQIADIAPKELLSIFKERKAKAVGPMWAEKIVKHASVSLHCKGTEAEMHRHVLRTNLRLLEDLDKLIEDLDKQISLLLYKTPGIYLLSIQGVSFVRIGEFIAEIGNPYKYREPGEWVKLAGLNASRYQSGKVDRQNNPITKVGNSYLRGTLFSIARDIARWEPLFIGLKEKFCGRGKHIQVAYGAVANKFLRVAFSLMLRKQNFDPSYEKEKKEKSSQNNN